MATQNITKTKSKEMQQFYVEYYNALETAQTTKNHLIQVWLNFITATMLGACILIQQLEEQKTPTKEQYEKLKISYYAKKQLENLDSTKPNKNKSVLENADCEEKTEFIKFLQKTAEQEQE